MGCPLRLVLVALSVLIAMQGALNAADTRAPSSSAWRQGDRHARSRSDVALGPFARMRYAAPSSR